MNNDPRPSKYLATEDKANEPRQAPFPLDKATISWNALKTATSELIVTSIIASDILDISNMQQPDRDKWANLFAQWGNAFPIPSQKPNPEHLIAAPNPDCTIGYNRTIMQESFEAQKYLDDYSRPIKADKQLLFPVVTIEVKALSSKEYAKRQNMHNSAVMLRNLRKLQGLVGGSEEELRTKFDNVPHVISIDFTQDVISICCCWSVMNGTGHLEFFSKPVAIFTTDQGLNDFRDMADKIRNAVEWAIEENKQWIRNDLKALEMHVSTLPSLEPVPSVVASCLSSEASGEQ